MSGIGVKGILVTMVVAAAAGVAVIVVLRFDPTASGPVDLGGEFVYDIEDLVRIDPSAIGYRKRFVLETGLGEARAVAVGSDDSIYVAGDRRIAVFESSGAGKSGIDTKGEPVCLAVAPDGTVYAGLSDRVEVYKGSDLRFQWPQAPGTALFTSIAVYGRNVFVADAGNRVVLRYDTDGRLVGEIGRRDESRGVPGFIVPSPFFDVAVGSDGLLRAANPGRLRIEAYTFDGYMEFFWGKPSMRLEGFCGCCNPANFAIMPGGGFVTVEKGLQRIKVYDSQGRFKTVVAGPAQFGGDVAPARSANANKPASGVFDVAVNSKGHVLVLDTLRNAVNIFTEIEDERNP